MRVVRFRAGLASPAMDTYTGKQRPMMHQPFSQVTVVLLSVAIGKGNPER